MVGLSTGNEASDAGLYAFCTISVRVSSSFRVLSRIPDLGFGYGGDSDPRARVPMVSGV